MLNVYDFLIGHEVSYKSVIDRVIEYIEDELRTKDGSKDMPLGLVDVLVNQVGFPANWQVPRTAALLFSTTV